MEIATVTNARAREFLSRYDPLEFATGIALFVIILWGDDFGAVVTEYAQNLVAVTIVSEFFMCWAGGGAVAASRTDGAFWRALCLIGGVGLYGLCVYSLLWDHSHWMLLQSVWIVCMRLRPRRGVPLLDTVHLQRVGYASLAGLLIVPAQLILRGLVILGLGALGVHMQVIEDSTMPPRWASAIIWCSFYFELALLGPVFAKMSAKAEE